MAQRRQLHFRLLRFKNFMFQLLRNKMSFTGVVLLGIFVFIALGAPLLTPYGPFGASSAGNVSGQVDQPLWYAQLVGGNTWSQNAEFSTMTVSPQTGIRLSMSPIGQTEDSVNFTLTIPSSSLPSTVLVAKTLTYPFDAPPKSFTGRVAVTPISLGGNATASSTVFLSRRGDTFTLWQKDMTVGLTYRPDKPLSAPLNFGSHSFSPSERIFTNSKNASFTYGLSISLPAGVTTASFLVQDFRLSLAGNTWGVMGTDAGGYDLFSQLVYGARISLAVGLIAAFIGIAVGLVVGLLAGYLGKLVDEVLMRFTDMMLVIPGLPLLIVLVAVLGPSVLNIILVLGFLGWMGFARLIRSQVLSLRERPFIEAAKASGAGTGYITARHIFPNIVSLTYVNLALSVPAAIVGEAALSFLGLGAQGVVSWGYMLEVARDSSSQAGLLWFWIVPPGIAIALMSLSFILMGYALDEMFNPRLRKRR